MGLRILQIYPKQDVFTGAAIQLRELAEGLRDRGHHLVVVTRPHADWTEWASRIGITHYGLPMRHPLDLGSAYALLRVVRAQRVDVAHAHKGLARDLMMLAGLVGPSPPMVVSRGVSFRLGWGSVLAYRSRWVTRVVTVSESIKAGMVGQGVPAEKIEVVYSGTDTERFDPDRVDPTHVRRELRLDSTVFLITQIGVRSWKGNDDMLEAFAQVRAEEPETHLLLVGAKAERAQALNMQVRQLGLAGSVTVWGNRTDIPEILAATDLTVDASYAGLGITGTLRESLAMETPVVATALEGNPELVQHDVTGLLVPPRDPAALAHAIIRLITDRRLARSTARAGRKLVLERFATRVKIDRFEALYRSLATKGSN
jgi:glycosyltransferase involved in cell wall biosynthesis